MLKILIACDVVIPVKKYGGTERVVWSLGKGLAQLGHEVTFLVREGSHADFARVVFIDQERRITEQIPEGVDLIHFHMFYGAEEVVPKPYLTTVHGHIEFEHTFDSNTVFVSRSHARHYNCDSYVHNGMAWDDLMAPVLDNKRENFHFLAKASWKVKNLKGAIQIIKGINREKLDVMGGTRYSERMLKMDRLIFCIHGSILKER